LFDFEKDRTALIVVDMQNDFVRVGAAIEVPDARQTIKPILRMIGFARRHNMPVIYTRFISGPKCFVWYPSIGQAAIDNCCLKGFVRHYPDVDKSLPCVDVIQELCPEPHDYIVDKYGYSAFVNTNLIDILHSEGRDTAIVTGTVTQICVGDTVHGGFHLGLKMIVASDCVSSFDPMQHEAALANIRLKYGFVDTTDAIIERYSR